MATEWGCDVRKVIELAPDSLGLEMTCGDYNLAQNINSRDPNWETRQFKEVMLIKRLDAKTISIQKTLNGKFKDRAWRAAYCPQETQRSYAEAKVMAAEKARRKAEEERALQNAHPRDGVYAMTGSDFEERCSKFGDTVVAFAGRSIVAASHRCTINARSTSRHRQDRRHLRIAICFKQPRRRQRTECEHSFGL